LGDARSRCPAEGETGIRIGRDAAAVRALDDIRDVADDIARLVAASVNAERWRSESQDLMQPIDQEDAFGRSMRFHDASTDAAGRFCGRGVEDRRRPLANARSRPSGRLWRLRWADASSTDLAVDQLDTHRGVFGVDRKRSRGEQARPRLRSRGLPKAPMPPPVCAIVRPRRDAADDSCACRAARTRTRPARIILCTRQKSRRLRPRGHIRGATSRSHSHRGSPAHQRPEVPTPPWIWLAQATDVRRRRGSVWDSRPGLRNRGADCAARRRTAGDQHGVVTSRAGRCPRRGASRPERLLTP
jgi:hypothetical protein